ncbi:hypothetical protein TWF788_009325 [Orbilia oligospora]|uniref:Uncharacterized protein n=1 Tax=Orbilia oligospora TaxID=2813651 RepID=A0A7C8PQW4_ORBOL|nr:hypothetical protein TWF788_009325 [Orbilia oligospora]
MTGSTKARQPAVAGKQRRAAVVGNRSNNPLLISNPYAGSFGKALSHLQNATEAGGGLIKDREML